MKLTKKLLALTAFLMLTSQGLFAALSLGTPSTPVRDASGGRIKHEVDLAFEPTDIFKLNNNFFSAQYDKAGLSAMTISTGNATVAIGMNNPLGENLFIATLYKTGYNLNKTAVETAYTNYKTKTLTDSDSSTHSLWASALLKDMKIAAIYGLSVTGTSAKGYYGVTPNYTANTFTFNNTSQEWTDKKENLSNYTIGVNNTRTYTHALTLTKKMEKFTAYLPIFLKFENNKKSAKYELKTNDISVEKQDFSQNLGEVTAGINAGFNGYKLPLELFVLQGGVGVDVLLSGGDKILASSTKNGTNYKWDMKKAKSKFTPNAKVEVSASRKFDKLLFIAKPIKMNYEFTRTAQDNGYTGTKEVGGTKSKFTNTSTTTTLSGTFTFNPEFGLEYTPGKIVSFRTGAKYNFQYTGSSSTIEYNSKLKPANKTTKTESMGATTSTIDIGAGMGFAFTENLSLDVVAAAPITDIGISSIAGTSLLSLANYNAMLTYRFGGNALVK